MSSTNETFHETGDEYKLDKEFDNENAETNRLRCALSSIAQEVQRFHIESQKQSESSENSNESTDLFGKLQILRKSLKKKENKINRLKTNIKSACTIAKSFMSAKEVETENLNNYLESARNEVTTLSAENRFRDSQLHKLSNEMNCLQENLDILHQVIGRGFLELEKIRKETHEDVPVLLQLKKILTCCGEYYADYSVERTRRLRLEQKNRYLNNKIIIMESNLHMVSEELKSHQQRTRSPKKKDQVKASDSDDEEERMDDPKGNSFTRLLDLSSHFSFVKNLLADQNCMLIDLKNLTNELNYDPD